MPVAHLYLRPLYTSLLILRKLKNYGEGIEIWRIADLLGVRSCHDVINIIRPSPGEWWWRETVRLSLRNNWLCGRETPWTSSLTSAVLSHKYTVYLDNDGRRAHSNFFYQKCTLKTDCTRGHAIRLRWLAFYSTVHFLSFCGLRAYFC